MPSPQIEEDLIKPVKICFTNSINMDNKEYAYGKKSPRTPNQDQNHRQSLIDK